MHALEVGSFEGRSTIWFLDNILNGEDSSITTVDIFLDKEIEDRFDRNICATGRWAQVVKKKGDSRSVLKELPLRSYDLVYIDGCHKAPCILSDAVLSFGLLRYNGLMIFDDYGLELFNLEPHMRPAAAIDAFLSMYREGLKVLHKSKGVVVVQKVLKK